jgi:predicted transcriptional regulator
MIYNGITMATNKQNIAIRIAPELVQELDKIAKAINRSRAWLGEDALRQYVEVQRWHLAEIAAGVDDIKSKRVVPGAEVESWLKSWGKPDEKPAPSA